jgi:hypothetical protein
MNRQTRQSSRKVASLALATFFASCTCGSPATLGTDGTDGVNGTGVANGTGAAPRFPGAGGDFQPFEGGRLECFYGPNSSTQPAATIEYVIETVQNQDALHARLTLDPAFVDNTYGTNAIGWPGKRGHTFEMLYRSDHAQILFANAANETVLDIKIDYVTASAGAPSGYATLGISGGDGALISGNASDVLQTNTSINRNLNERGYTTYTVDSPATDSNYTPNPATPNWDYRVVYEAWIKKSAFGNSGFQRAYIDHIHASPSKSTDTLYVTPGPCPPAWGIPGDGLGEGGTSCTSNNQCASFTCENGVCLDEVGGGGAPRLPGGSACTVNSQCASLSCVSGTCLNEAGTGGLPGGAPCSTNNQCASVSCEQGFCLNETGSGSGLPGGSSCTTNSNCASLTCVNGSCLNENGTGTATNLPGGSTCTTNVNCASYSCENGSCLNEAGGSTTGLPGGSACVTNENCASYSCVNGSCLNEAGSGNTNLPGGSACSTNVECASYSCVGGSCLNEGGTGGGATGLPGGSLCATNSQCVSKTCSNGVCLNEGGGYPNGAPCSTNGECQSLNCVAGSCASVELGATGGELRDLIAQLGVGAALRKPVGQLLAGAALLDAGPTAPRILVREVLAAGHLEGPLGDAGSRGPLERLVRPAVQRRGDVDGRRARHLARYLHLNALENFGLGLRERRRVAHLELKRRLVGEANPERQVV